MTKITLNVLSAFFIFTAFALTDFAVNADSLNWTYEIKTNSDFIDGWKVATLYTALDAGYVNPTKNGEKYTATGTKWSAIADKFPFADQDWNGAAGGNRYTWKDATEWIAAVNDGTGTTDANKVANGFYAFEYSLYAVNGDTSVKGLLNLTMGADDYIAAIYANGTQLYSDEIKVGSKVTSDQHGVGTGGNFTNWLGFTNDIPFDVDLVDGSLNLVFVVHNTNAASTNMTNGKPYMNPMGLYVNGTLKTNIELGKNVTPEPATMLILGLGVAGLGLARRRR